MTRNADTDATLTHYRGILARLEDAREDREAAVIRDMKLLDEAEGQGRWL
jgi:hypothetical protein